MADLVVPASELLARDARRDADDVRFSRHFRAYRCRCGNSLFFANTQCRKCGAQLGYLPDEGRLAPLDEGPEARTWGPRAGRTY